MPRVNVKKFCAMCGAELEINPIATGLCSEKCRDRWLYFKLRSDDPKRQELINKWKQ